MCGKYGKCGKVEGNEGWESTEDEGRRNNLFLGGKIKISKEKCGRGRGK